MADERANIFFRAYNVRSRVQQPMFGERHNALLLLSKPPQRRQSGAVAHDFGSLHRFIDTIYKHFYSELL